MTNTTNTTNPTDEAVKTVRDVLWLVQGRNCDLNSLDGEIQKAVDGVKTIEALLQNADSVMQTNQVLVKRLRALEENQHREGL